MVNVACAAVRSSDGRYLIARRANHKAFPLCWEFPGGKIEPGETAHAAVIRELREELDLAVAVSLEPLAIHDFRCTDADCNCGVDFRIALFAAVPLTGTELRLKDAHDVLRWVTLGEAADLMATEKTTLSFPAHVRALGEADGRPQH